MTYNFSFVVASRYALSISVPHTSFLFSSARNMTNLKYHMEATSEYILSTGSGVRCPPATSLAL